MLFAVSSGPIMCTKGLYQPLFVQAAARILPLRWDTMYTLLQKKNGLQFQPFSRIKSNLWLIFLAYFTNNQIHLFWELIVIIFVYRRQTLNNPFVGFVRFLWYSDVFALWQWRAWFVMYICIFNCYMSIFRRGTREYLVELIQSRALPCHVCK